MYTYFELLDDVDYLGFCGARTGIVGVSEAGFDIPYVFFGEDSGPQIVVVGGIHARENVSAAAVVRQAFYILRGMVGFGGGNGFASEVGVRGETGFGSRVGFGGGIYFVPMLNVDGALLIQKGADFFGDRREFLLKTNGGSGDFSLWKANINGVDLNTNFDAEFGTGVSNICYPAPANYTGKAPFDQSETRALRDFTLKIAPAATISYHALGRELYWYFGQTQNYDRDHKIATEIATHLGYKKIDSTLGSAGGYKDWCIKKLNIPALTIELGKETLTHPVTESQIEEDLRLNRDVAARVGRMCAGE